ncbi:hypothetical protein J6590_087868 [Homalodisca vitripennis]|nr:hypothetical protein J6590_087868 [Homalodisca vitripennis]
MLGGARAPPARRHCSLQSEGVVVVFVWKRADEGAKGALELQHLTTRMMASDITAVVKAKIKEKLSSGQPGITSCAVLRTVKPWGTASRSNRRGKVVLCRLRLSRTLLTTDSS